MATNNSINLPEGSAGQLVTNTGTGFANTTATYPSIAGASGKVLQSNGTNFVESTPTYPSSSGTAGKILRSDGTNNIYSTSTFADTYGASQLLYSNGANTVQGLATANTATLQTDSSGVPSWVSGVPIKTINTQTITTTGAGTYTPTAGTKFAIFELLGAGGGSGGTTGSPGNVATSGAGGSGSYLKILATAANIGVSCAVSVGVGGLAGTAGNNPGGDGGDTTITINGSTWTAKHGNGGGGQAGNAATQNSGSSGSSNGNTTGANATLIVNMQGQSGLRSISNPTFGFSSIGGSSFYGRSDSTAITGFGAGGPGLYNVTGADLAGVAGGNGIIIVTEFIS